MQWYILAGFEFFTQVLRHPDGLKWQLRFTQKRAFGVSFTAIATRAVSHCYRAMCFCELLRKYFSIKSVHYPSKYYFDSFRI